MMHKHNVFISQVNTMQTTIYNLIKDCLYRHPDIRLLKLIISLSPNDENIQLVNNYINSCKDMTTHINTFMSVVKRRPYLRKHKLKLPQDKDITNIMLSMYTYYCKQQIDVFMCYIRKVIKFDINKVVSYCTEHNLYNELLIALCGYISNVCSKYRQYKVNEWVLRHHFNKQRNDKAFIPIEYPDVNKYMKPFIANTYLYNIELLPILEEHWPQPMTNNIYVYNTDMFIKVDSQILQRWRLTKRIKKVLSLNVNDCDNVVEINYELYLAHPWYDELTISDYKNVNDDVVNIWLLWFIVNFNGVIYIHNNKLYSPWCIYNINNQDDNKQDEIYKVLTKRISINDITKYMTTIINTNINYKNEILNRLQQLKTDIKKQIS